MVTLDQVNSIRELVMTLRDKRIRLARPRPVLFPPSLITRSLAYLAASSRFVPFVLLWAPFADTAQEHLVEHNSIHHHTHFPPTEADAAAPHPADHTVWWRLGRAFHFL